MSNDFVPVRDGEFRAWSQALVGYAAAHPAELGLAAGDLTAASAAQSAFEQAEDAAVAAHAQARASTAAKREARRTLDQALRQLARRLQASPAVSDGERTELGLPIRDKKPTRAPIPASAPLLTIDLMADGQGVRHVIHFRDSATPGRKVKPKGRAGHRDLAPPRRPPRGGWGLDAPGLPHNQPVRRPADPASESRAGHERLVSGEMDQHARGKRPVVCSPQC